MACGDDVSRTIRETKNPNSHTPIVAVTAYSIDPHTPDSFDALIEEPVSSSKLIEVLGKLCGWQPAAPSDLQEETAEKESQRGENSSTQGLPSYASQSAGTAAHQDDTASSGPGNSGPPPRGDDIPDVAYRVTSAGWEVEENFTADTSKRRRRYSQ